MSERPITYEDLHSYVPQNGTLEFWRGVGTDQMEFKFKTQTSDGHKGEFSCIVAKNLAINEEDKQKMLKCVQQAHDWRAAHEAAPVLPS